MLVGLVLVTSLAGESLIAGIMMTVLGLLISLIGIDPVRGAPRFTFGIPELYDGLGFIPVVMGLFGIGEILATVERPYRDVIKTKLSGLIPSREEWRRSMGAIAAHEERLRRRVEEAIAENTRVERVESLVRDLELANTVNGQLVRHELDLIDLSVRSLARPDPRTLHRAYGATGARTVDAPAVPMLLNTAA